ncbi:MAG: hypothetical protein NT106_07615 [Candidatus Sumerlaeota bacterium]|nr:hypothetical protein [Candidatus Sumerlaeota bacterium]
MGEKDMLLRDLMLHLKSLLWCLNKDRERYNIKMILDCLHSLHVPESIHRTPLGQNLNYLIEELSSHGGLGSLPAVLRRLSESRITLDCPLGSVELGQYLVSIQEVGKLPRGTYGVISYLGRDLYGLFYHEGQGLIEKKVLPEQVKVIYGTTI